MLYDPKWEPEVKVAPWRQVLLDMIKVLEERGWCQGTLEDGSGAVCFAGAFNLVTSGKATVLGSTGPLRWSEVAGKMYKTDGWGPIDWNDHPGRTKEQVIQKLRDLATK